MQAAIALKLLIRIMFDIIASTDLINLTYNSIDQQTAIDDFCHPSLIAVVEKAVELVLQIRQCNINVDSKKIWFPEVVPQLGGC
ncbi:hypothetical protein A2U01_0007909 [Trifolium medium]|uniref:Secreted protein n=1 Tax=Trifolium medium TaxID=97028 RepID=A0A392ML93_9FABA|nr:hypothetical protein [Trifolium medium]